MNVINVRRQPQGAAFYFRRTAEATLVYVVMPSYAAEQLVYRCKFYLDDRDDMVQASSSFKLEGTQFDEPYRPWMARALNLIEQMHHFYNSAITARMWIDGDIDSSPTVEVKA
jgi:hypothetical protein